jgi:hypothetical protein
VSNPYEDDMKEFHEKLKQERLYQSYEQQMKDRIKQLEAINEGYERLVERRELQVERLLAQVDRLLTKLELADKEKAPETEADS